MNLYVASSWKNQRYELVIEELRTAGFGVLDWRNPKPGDNGFHWSEINGGWKNWSVAEYKAALLHPIAEAGFQSDFSFMKQADACVCLLPCGKSAHLEAGWFCGQGRPVFFLIFDQDFTEAELMYKLGNGVFDNLFDLIGALRELL